MVRPRGTGHKMVTVKVGKRCAQIDKLIAPLIRELWRAGIETMMSCQGDDKGKVWIAFVDLNMLTRFLNAVVDYEPDPNALYNRACGHFRHDRPDQDWEFALWPFDGTFYDLNQDPTDATRVVHNGFVDVLWQFSVRFPRSDLETVMTRVCRHNRQSRRAGNGRK